MDIKSFMWAAFIPIAFASHFAPPPSLSISRTFISISIETEILCNKDVWCLTEWKKKENVMSTCPFHFCVRMFVRVIVLFANWYYFYLFVDGNINFILLLRMRTFGLCLSHTINWVLYRVGGTIYLIENEAERLREQPHCTKPNEIDRILGVRGVFVCRVRKGWGAWGESAVS